MQTTGFAIEQPDAPGPVIVVCEHASNHFPAPWGDLGLSAEQQQAHIAWDPGAFEVAGALAQLLDAPLVYGTVSRLIYDLNRPPDSPSAMAERSEIHDIPGNRGLSAKERLHRTEAIYLPFHNSLSDLLSRRLAGGQRPVLLTVHSFTPVYSGQRRGVELGIIHDADNRLALAIAAGKTGLLTELNRPYSAADGVTHLLARHATPMGLHSAMLELRNDLIAKDHGKMAARLAPVIQTAIDGVT